MAVVGDHPTFGLGVADEQIYPRLLESRVKAPQGLRLVTVNLSMYHYNTSQKLELFRLRGPRYHPDFVILQVGPGFKNLSTPLFNFPALKNFVRAHSRLARCFMERLFWMRSRKKAPAVMANRPPGPGPLLENMRAFGDLLKALDVKGLVVYVPDLTENQADARETEARFREAAQRAGLPYKDISPAFASSPPASWLIFPYSKPPMSWRLSSQHARPINTAQEVDGEPFLNAAGQSVIAQQVAPIVAKWLKDASRRRVAGRPLPGAL